MKKQNDYPITGKLKIENNKVFVDGVEVPVYADIVSKETDKKDGKRVFAVCGHDYEMIYEFTRKWFGRWKVGRYQYIIGTD